MILLADAKPSICMQGLKELEIKLPCKVDLLKLSHHGSKNNTSDVLLKNLTADIYICSVQMGTSKRFRIK